MKKNHKSRHFPKKIRIGAIDFRTKAVTRLTDDENSQKLTGEISYRHAKIRVEVAQDDQAAFQTMWHEVFHGILTQAGSDLSSNETLIEQLSNGTVGVLRDNVYLRGNWLWKP
jgi:hypothetical protein